MDVIIKCQGNPSNRHLLLKGMKVNLTITLEEESGGCQSQFQLLLVDVFTEKAKGQVVQAHKFIIK